MSMLSSIGASSAYGQVLKIIARKKRGESKATKKVLEAIEKEVKELQSAADLGWD